jgi:N-acetylglucosaminyldiphosphoundecaprenol N-acetyl-beta-D-mannosaminyltransferase
MEIAKSFISGVRIDRVSMDETVTQCDQFIRTRVPHQVVVVNAAKLVKAQTDKYLRHIINEADLVGADGMPLVWLSKLLGDPIPGRVNGTDLMEKLVEHAARKGYSIYFLGAKLEVVRKVVDTYKEKYPDLKVAGYRDGYFNPEDETAVADEIRASGADIIFLAFGSPKKEKFVRDHLFRMNVPLVHGVGGSFDVVAGITKRAPVWMQNAGLEWFYRFLQEPSRMWKRYLFTNVEFMAVAALEVFRRVPPFQRAA